jgi:hypothetical protein
MGDTLTVQNATGLVYTGVGHLSGLIVSCNSTTPGLVQLYDGLDNTGTKFMEVQVTAPQPLIIFFSENFAPFFSTGLYIYLAASLTATLWTRRL